MRRKQSLPLKLRGSDRGPRHRLRNQGRGGPGDPGTSIRDTCHVSPESQVSSGLLPLAAFTEEFAATEPSVTQQQPRAPPFQGTVIFRLLLLLHGLLCASLRDSGAAAPCGPGLF